MKSRVIGVDSTWRAPELSYAYDDSVYFKDSLIYHTAEGISIPTANILSDAVDVSINQYSGLYLTDQKKLSEFIGIKTSYKPYPRTYITFFADSYGWVDGIDPETKCWYVVDTAKTQEEMEPAGEMVSFGFDRPYSSMSSEMLFEVELLTSRLLRILHWDGYKHVYLTANYDNLTVGFDFENTTAALSSNPQIFEYSLDEETSYITIYGNYDGQYYDFRTVGSGVILYPTTNRFYIPNAYKNTGIPRRSTELPLYDNWVSYTTGLVQNNLNISPSKSYTDLYHNFLINSQYIGDNSLNTVNINFLPLKNHLTCNYSQSRNSPFRFSKSTKANAATLYRDYSSINSGTNQTTGLENIFLNYSDYTQELTFSKDKMTYFHMPPDMYPLAKLNIADSGLVNAGAIAGDKPLRSDKVFKKRANYKDYTPWGHSTDEQSSVYLCSWLYCSGVPGEPAQWLDRYYNPKKYTIFQAMTASHIVEFVTTFDNMVTDNPSTSKYVVFDKTSDLCFEPGVLYCYHRIGQTDITNSISRLALDIIQTGFDTYEAIDGTEKVNVYDNNSQVYSFDGKTVAKTGMLTPLLDSNSFSINFSMYSDDWSAYFGNQLLGNYTNDGFGIFNTEMLTPILLTRSASSVQLLNTDYKLAATFPGEYEVAFKSPLSENLFLYSYAGGGTLDEYDLNSILQEQTDMPLYTSTFPPSALYPYSFANDSSRFYMLYNNSSYASVDLKTESLDTHADALVHIHTDLNLEQKPIVSTILPVSGMVYGLDVPTVDVTRSGEIWWLKNNNIYSYSTRTEDYNTELETSDYIIKDFKIDIEDNIYILYRSYIPVDSHFDYKILKVDSSMNSIFNISLSSIAPRLSGLAPDASFAFNLISQSVSGAPISYMSLLTDYISSWEDVDENNEPVVHEDTLTDVTNINLDGEYHSNTLLPLVSNLTTIDSNYRYYKQNLYHELDGNNLTFKMRLRNTYDRDLYEDLDISIDVADLDPGWHHICYDYSSILGTASVFIDSELLAHSQVPPDMYRFSDASIQKYVIGTTPAFNGIQLNEFLSQPSNYICTNFKIKDFYMYNKSLNYYDIKFFYRQLGNIRDIKWTIPSNSRNYIDEMQQVFNHRRPPIKTNTYDINILSDVISSPEMKSTISADLRLKLFDQLPANSSTDNINWYRTS